MIIITSLLILVVQVSLVSSSNNVIHDESTCNDDFCNLEFFETCEEFKNKFWKQKPGVFRGGLSSIQEHFRTLTSHEALLKQHDLRIKLSTSVSYTGRIFTEKSVAEYAADDSPVSKYGNETFYLFGNHEGEAWDNFLNNYVKLESNRGFFQCLSLNPVYSTLSFGCAKPETGVPFHFHGDGFLEVLHGRKMWFLSPPEISKEQIHFDPNITTRNWYHQEYPKVANIVRKCTLEQGDVIYFPPMWLHATYNMGSDWNSWISTFL